MLQIYQLKSLIKAIKLTKIATSKIKIDKIYKLNKNLLNKSKKHLKISNLIPKNKLSKNDLGLLIILSSVILFAFYFYGIGRNRYYVRSDVIVRKVNSGDTSSGGSLLGLLGGGNLAATEDARFLKVYLESPQVLKKIDNFFDFNEVYKKNSFDTFAGLNKNASNVKKFYFFKKQISLSLDEQSGIIILRTFGYQPKTAYDLNNFLIEESELFVNNLNQDIYKKQLKFAESQHNKSKELVDDLTLKLSNFQNKNKFLDAQSEATARIGFISGLENQLLTEKLELATLKRQFIRPDDPEILKVENLIKDLEEQIKSERQLIAGISNDSLNQKLIESEKLKNAIIFAKERFSATLLTLEKTKSDSLQKQRFMAILREPLYPDAAWQKWRHKGFLTGVASLLVGFSVTKFILGMSDSHRN